MSPRIEFYGTDGSVQRRPPQGGSITHRLTTVKELGDIVELSFAATNPQHLKPEDPEVKKIVLPISHYANMQTNPAGTYDVFREKKTSPGRADLQQTQTVKYYVGLDIRA
jgi:hypothetical protein